MPSNLPSNPTLDFEQLAPDLIATAKEAGRAIMSVYAGADFGTTYKEDDSPLTRADLASHKLIVGRLRSLTPHIPILSEEAKGTPYSERRNWERFWLVDPLDGTKEFIKRNGEFTVNIALIDGDRPGFGVVHAPALDLTYWAAASLGAFKGENPIHVQTYEAGPLKVVASRSHAGAQTEALVAELQRDTQVDLLSIGSSLKLCLVAEGSAHLYPRFGPTMEWDTAAAQCVVEGAGGFVRDTSGEPLRYNKEDLLNPHFIVTGTQALFGRAARVAAAG